MTMRPRWRCVGGLVYGLQLIVSGCAEGAGSHLQIDGITFQTTEGYVFDARIVTPPPRQRNGCGVLLMGGGFGNDRFSQLYGVVVDLLGAVGVHDVTWRAATSPKACSNAGSSAARSSSVSLTSKTITRGIGAPPWLHSLAD